MRAIPGAGAMLAALLVALAAPAPVAAQAVAAIPAAAAADPASDEESAPPEQERRSRHARAKKPRAKKAATTPSGKRRKSPGFALLWSLLPGGGQFYLGETGAGIGYAATSGAFLIAGSLLDHRNNQIHDENCGSFCRDRRDELNTPSLVGQKIWTFAVFSAWRDALAMNGEDLRARRVDDTPSAQLVLAPFMPEQLFNPWVFGAAVLGGGAAWLSGIHADHRQRDVSRVGMWGDDWNRDEGTAIYGASAFSVALGAGVAEEALFRGVLQPVTEEAWGTTPGYLATSGMFGLAHLVGANGHFQPGAVLSATAAGLYLGYLYDSNGHRLAPGIAAHFWYDFMIFAVGFLADPENNPMGVKVRFNL